MSHILIKGDRVRARWFQVDNPSGALAGVQTKFTGTHKIVEGVVTHIRGDSPSNPQSIHVWVQPDNGAEVEVDIKLIEAVYG